MTVSQHVLDQLSDLGVEHQEDWDTLLDPDTTLEDHIDLQSHLTNAQLQLEEVDRLTDLAQGLEELAAIGDGILEATPTELRLMHQATQMGLAGSGVAVEALLPSLESSLGTTVSTESLKRAAKAVWDGIVRTIKGIWQAIRNFFSGVKGDLQRLKMRNVQLRFQAENSSGKSIRNRKTKLGREINSLTSYHRPPRSAKDITMGLSEFKRQGAVIYGKYCDTIIEIGQRLEAGIRAFDFNNPETSLKNLVSIANTLDLKGIAQLSGTVIDLVDGRWENGTAVRPTPLMGNRSVVYVTPKTRMGSDSTLALSEAVRNRRATLVMSSPTTRNVEAEGDVDTFPASAVIEISHLVDDILRQISESDKKLKQLDKTHKALRKASDWLAKQMEGKQELPATTKSMIRSALSFNVAYAHWSSQPQSSFASLSISVCRAAMIASNRCLKNYG